MCYRINNIHSLLTLLPLIQEKGAEYMRVDIMDIFCEDREKEAPGANVYLEPGLTGKKFFVI